MTEFKQIVGRGTRVHEDTDKYYFTLIDFRKATNHFADPDFDGEPVQIYEPDDDDPMTPPDGGDDDDREPTDPDGGDESRPDENGSDKEGPDESDAAPLVDDEQLVSFVRDRLAGFKIPKTVAYVDELPRTVSGTVDREAVRRILRDRGYDPRRDADLETAGFEPAEPTEPAGPDDPDDPATAPATSNDREETGDGERVDDGGTDDDDETDDQSVGDDSRDGEGSGDDGSGDDGGDGDEDAAERSEAIDDRVGG
jgi:O-succinylbenzoic acid--CoA ligase